MRIGTRIAVDVGDVRVGVARCDTAGILATPVATYRRERDDFSSVIELVREADALEVIVGLPRNMDGSEGKSAKNARRWAKRLARRIAPVHVRMVDERLTTVSAHQMLHESGRKEINHRSVVDQVAAVIILESALAQERTTGMPPGELVELQEK
ncbi:Holliday junction resolvase RuvX [Arcanobacterium haemolyticum]|uniref:Putative pre-16S rRNA nuclease n=1 Tax=Arcanobacterium haemolyticum (strain ATCC 9345 / DSM 20595 / CCM 5947 / CCUG 17215 / LMG 16163 / NBRC 15585 / NCTC 8452 / 11018) TaxID=644284 RepID=D7BNS0_ARCHD|nr:Holliday junction resolvase RuvX [Arcanobacterium haemolyticum]ADH92569.1 Holliday junction resolvase YqgF [Arcanobacterium haemolyticum DSM 20595]QCX46688.1 Holliday junction resolvase RuvX [Arcanobacterium haemolyticum]SPT74454.1 Putative Holliday junction resolvase [Arcanobacterium haemolyticum]SQH28697.1 Putative Holliday junction resolvase [Arcanobacterium haemolyticum]